MTDRTINPFCSSATILCLAAGLVATLGSASGRAEPPASSPAPQTGDFAAAAGKSQKAPLRLGTQLYAAYRLRNGDPNHAFEARRARLGIYFAPLTWFDGQIEFDFAGLTLKDAYGRLILRPWLKITAGQFKKPFSRLELTPPRRLGIWRRGITNDRIVEQFGFGGRDLGLMVSGSLLGLRYSVGVFNGGGVAPEVDNGKGVAMRLTYRPMTWLRMGVSGSMNYRDQLLATSNRPDIWGAGVDLRLRLGPVDLMLEGLWGQGGQTARGPQSLGVLLSGRGRFALADHIELEPVLKSEILDDNLWRSRDLAWSLTLGANLRFFRMVRLMFQGEMILSEPVSDAIEIGGDDVAREEFLLILQLAFDHKFDVRVAEIID